MSLPRFEMQMESDRVQGSPQIQRHACALKCRMKATANIDQTSALGTTLKGEPDLKHIVSAIYPFYPIPNSSIDEMDYTVSFTKLQFLHNFGENQSDDCVA